MILNQSVMLGSYVYLLSVNNETTGMNYSLAFRAVSDKM